MFGIDFDTTFIVKFVFCFIIFVILPVWVFRLVDISFLYKVSFTVAGGIGVLIALGGKTMKGFSGRR